MIQLHEKLKYNEIADNIVSLQTEALKNILTDATFLLPVPCKRTPNVNNSTLGYFVFFGNVLLKINPLQFYRNT